MKNDSLFFIAGEASGDLHGAALIQALKDLKFPWQFSGIGGDQMEAAGLKTLLPFKDFQVMGFSDILRAYPRLRRHFYSIVEKILEIKPQGVVFIDYPGFNLRLAKTLRKRGYRGKLIHYIAPTVWAWGKARVKSMQATLDLLLTIYPFEPAYFPKVLTKYVGNPLMTQEKSLKPNWREELGIPHNLPLLALFPGSRPKELARNLPLELKAAEILQKRDPAWGFAISLSHPDFHQAIASELKKSSLTNCWIVPQEYRYNLMRESKAALAKSGTINLELALEGCPTVVLYQLTYLNYFLAKYVFRVSLPNYSLPNILLQERLFPEWYGVNLSPEHLAASLKEQLGKDITAKSQALKTLLTGQNASQTAAQAIYEILT